MTGHYTHETPHQIRKHRLALARDFKTRERGDDRRVVEAATRFGRPGQCGTCGAFRADGLPPTVHRTDCIDGPAGWDLEQVPDPAGGPATIVRAPRGRRRDRATIAADQADERGPADE